MKRLRSAGLILVGIGLGAICVAGAPLLAKQQTSGQRLVFIPAYNPGAPNMQFIKDQKSGGCWLGSVVTVPAGRQSYLDVTVLAAAPTTACQ